MSAHPTHEPGCRLTGSKSAIELSIDARSRDVAGLPVRRLLPSRLRRHVGPFVFLDHMGPVSFERGRGFDVPPHPHIGLATVTYLFDGEIVHRDSLGSSCAIRPGDVNWMVAGSGIAHSERSGDEARREGPRLHGVQSWLALPAALAEAAPAFEHHPQAALPVIERDGVVLDVIAGSAYGAVSPVGVVSPTLYVHARVDAGAPLPVDGEHEERAVYVVEGRLRCGDEIVEEGTLAVLEPGRDVVLAAERASRALLIGGARLDGERHIWWNFVASSEQRIDVAKEAWKQGRFAKIPGDDVEFVPLPER